MKNKFKKYLIVFGGAWLLSSCASSENIVYFQDLEGVKVADSLLNFDPKIQVGDLLDINVSAIDAEAALPFNLYETPLMGTTVSNAKPITYLVNSKGDIHFPVLGDIKVGGFTTNEINEHLIQVLKTYINNPIVNIRLTNFKVTVLGEVNKPGAYAVANERISVLDAIGLAGDLTIHGERKTVTLIRAQNGKQVYVNLDLTSKELFSSPYYFLSQNDVIYVAPNKTKVNSSKVGANTGVIVSSVSILISLVAILLK